MTVIWDGKVLLETIILNEEKSAQIYTYISDNLESKEEKELFISLSADEERHAKIYEALQRQFSMKSEVEISQEDVDYIELVISNNIFSQDEDYREEVRRFLEKTDIFTLAEKMERDAIIYILELQEMYPNLAREELETILREERKHLRLVFTKKIDNLRKQS